MKRRTGRWAAWPIVGLVVGIMSYYYGSALAALLIMECDSFYPPFESARCAQPFVAVVLGALIFLVSTIAGLLALWAKILRTIRNHDGKGREDR